MRRPCVVLAVDSSVVLSQVAGGLLQTNLHPTYDKTVDPLPFFTLGDRLLFRPDQKGCMFRPDQKGVLLFGFGCMFQTGVLNGNLIGGSNAKSI